MLLLSVNRYNIFLSTCPLQSLELHCWRKNNSRRKSFCLLVAPMYQKPQFSAPHFPSHFTEYSPISSFTLILRLAKTRFHYFSSKRTNNQSQFASPCLYYHWVEARDKEKEEKPDDNMWEMKQRYFSQKKSLLSRKQQMMRKNEISDDNTDDGNDKCLNRQSRIDAMGRKSKTGQSREWCWTYDASCAMRNCIYQNKSKLLTSQKINSILGRVSSAAIFCESFKITATFLRENFSCQDLQ